MFYTDFVYSYTWEIHSKTNIRLWIEVTNIYVHTCDGIQAVFCKQMTNVCCYCSDILNDIISKSQSRSYLEVIQV